MSKRWAFDDKQPFIEKLRERVDSGVPPERLDTRTPFHVHEVEEILKIPESPVRFFALAGALLGLFGGLGFVLFTVWDYPLLTGGKPIFSITAFIVIAFETTILLGGVVTKLGFLHLARLPDVHSILNPEEHYNQFVIVEEGGDEDLDEEGQS